MLDFKNVCGHTFAVTGSALYHLVATGQDPLGSWVQVPLAATDAGLALPIGKIQADASGLFVYRERGVVERLTGLTCLAAE